VKKLVLVLVLVLLAALVASVVVLADGPMGEGSPLVASGEGCPAEAQGEGGDGPTQAERTTEYNGPSGNGTMNTERRGPEELALACHFHLGEVYRPVSAVEQWVAQGHAEWGGCPDDGGTGTIITPTTTITDTPGMIYAVFLPHVANGVVVEEDSIPTTTPHEAPVEDSPSTVPPAPGVWMGFLPLMVPLAWVERVWACLPYWLTPKSWAFAQGWKNRFAVQAIARRLRYLSARDKYRTATHKVQGRFYNALDEFQWKYINPIASRVKEYLYWPRHYGRWYSSTFYRIGRWADEVYARTMPPWVDTYWDE
jgi:hypothetical protein